MRNVLRGLPARNLREFVVRPAGPLRESHVLLSVDVVRGNAAPLNIHISGKLEKVWGSMDAELSKEGRGQALKVLRALEKGLRNVRPRKIRRETNKSGGKTEVYSLGPVLRSIGIDHEFVLQRIEIRGRSTSVFRRLKALVGGKLVDAEAVVPFECSISLSNGGITDEKAWLGEVPVRNEWERKLRRRIEDTLRKEASREQLEAIASMLGMSVD